MFKNLHLFIFQPFYCCFFALHDIMISSWYPKTDIETFSTLFDFVKYTHRLVTMRKEIRHKVLFPSLTPNTFFPITLVLWEHTTPCGNIRPYDESKELGNTVKKKKKISVSKEGPLGLSPSYQVNIKMVYLD